MEGYPLNSAIIRPPFYVSFSNPLLVLAFADIYQIQNITVGQKFLLRIIFRDFSSFLCFFFSPSNSDIF